ncbi:hypothetical protein CHO01_31880 [Cellulomonas hominis]|uniref:Uncharacterized protein n=1 Tax=Cellulomonas hominis TaxID=156981 RepID=A0A511FFW0_9CELL|nr:hypothetical protein [Cellulomonas hominis]MBB5474848.1 hypothetical protein [Cellulomonas hominis]NKY05627.1 hypothetical protein [Cellulomonas hominis]GEL48072.1 hypothetical protein CHO01_31880 [Cellulomonas hominis]
MSRETAPILGPTCMICLRPEGDHPARIAHNTCLVTFDAARSTYAQGEDRARLALWPAEAWEAYRRLHRLTADRYQAAPSPEVAAWVQRLRDELARAGTGSLYQHPVGLW